MIALATCRKQFFERELFGTSFALKFEVSEIVPWTSQDRDRYIQAFHSRFKSARDRVATEAYRSAFTWNRDFGELCLNPLILNMALELGPERLPEFQSATDICTIYNVFANHVLRLERARFASDISLEDYEYILEELAWQFIPLLSLRHKPRIPFRESEIYRLIGHLTKSRNAGIVVRDVLNSLFITTLWKFPEDPEPISIEFSHKSFQEYFVARKFYTSLTTPDAQISDLFLIFETPEISEFIKGFIHRINDVPSHQATAVQQ